MMKTGIQNGPCAFPKPVSFTHLVFLQQKGMCKNIVSCKTSTYVVASPFVFPVIPCFRAFDNSTNELVGVNAARSSPYAWLPS